MSYFTVLTKLIPQNTSRGLKKKKKEYFFGLRVLHSGSVSPFMADFGCLLAAMINLNI